MRQLDAFLQCMRDFGWVEGQNIEYRMAFADGDMQRLDQLAAELAAQKVDVILVGAAPDVRAAQRVTTTIPLVMVYVTNAAGLGFIASLSRPGNNITGISNQYEETIAKLIEVLHETVPSARRIAVLVNENSPAHTTFWAGAQAACTAFGLEPLRVAASVPAQLDDAVAQMVANRAQAVVIPGDAMHLSERARLLELLRPTRLPVAAGFAEFAIAGALLSFGADSVQTMGHASTFVDKVLKGAKPADLPVEQPTKFELVLNVATAKSLGITFPQSLRVRADEVIQ